MELDYITQTNKYFKGKDWSAVINTCSYIVLHHTAWGTYESNIKILCKNNNNVSCHFIIWKGGEIAQISNPIYCTRHAWKSKRDGKTSLNYYSIGIEIVSDWTNFNDKQRKSTRELVNYLINNYWISEQNIIRHKDIAPWRKIDVWDNFWNKNYSSWDKYQQSYSKETKTWLWRIWYNIIRLLIKKISKTWNTTENTSEKDILHKTNESLRWLMMYYKKKY